LLHYWEICLKVCFWFCLTIKWFCFILFYFVLFWLLLIRFLFYPFCHLSLTRDKKMGFCSFCCLAQTICPKERLKEGFLLWKILLPLKEKKNGLYDISVKCLECTYRESYFILSGSLIFIPLIPSKKIRGVLAGLTWWNCNFYAFGFVKSNTMDEISHSAFIIYSTLLIRTTDLLLTLIHLIPFY